MANQLTFVAYYRVSIERQGQSGLCLDAQKAAVAAYMHGQWDMEAEFVEVESGRKELPATARRRARPVPAQARPGAGDRQVGPPGPLGCLHLDLDGKRGRFRGRGHAHANKLTMHVLATVAVANRNYRRLGSQSSAGRARDHCNGLEGSNSQ